MGVAHLHPFRDWDVFFCVSAHTYQYLHDAQKLFEIIRNIKRHETFIGAKAFLLVYEISDSLRLRRAPHLAPLILRFS